MYFTYTCEGDNLTQVIIAELALRERRHPVQLIIIHVLSLP